MVRYGFCHALVLNFDDMNLEKIHSVRSGIKLF